MSSAALAGNDRENGDGLKRAIGVSLIAHAALFLVMIIKSIVAPSEPKQYLPSLRVDLVALPGHKITEAVIPSTKEVVEKPKEKAHKEVETKPKNDEEVTLPTKKKSDRMKNALAKIKALEKVSESEKPAEPIRGNRISKGSSISGEAKTSLETTYYDVVLEKVRTNWELPRWLQDQKLSAQVLVFIDRKGMISSFRFTKSSGNDQFDQEVKRALHSSAPFPIPPTSILADLAGDGITLGFPL